MSKEAEETSVFDNNDSSIDCMQDAQIKIPAHLRKELKQRENNEALRIKALMPEWMTEDSKCYALQMLSVPQLLAHSGMYGVARDIVVDAYIIELSRFELRRYSRRNIKFDLIKLDYCLNISNKIPNLGTATVVAAIESIASGWEFYVSSCIRHPDVMVFLEEGESKVAEFESYQESELLKAIAKSFPEDYKVSSNKLLVDVVNGYNGNNIQTVILHME